MMKVTLWKKRKEGHDDVHYHETRPYMDGLSAEEAYSQEGHGPQEVEENWQRRAHCFPGTEEISPTPRKTKTTVLGSYVMP